MIRIPMESDRLAAAPEAIDEYFCLLSQYIDGTPAYFVSNADEMGPMIEMLSPKSLGSIGLSTQRDETTG
jgi:hypothetical protein